MTVADDELSRKDRSTMEQLWAPWRLSYITTAKQSVAAERCFICDGLAAADDRANLVALRTPRSVVVLLNRAV